MRSFIFMMGLLTMVYSQAEAKIELKKIEYKIGEQTYESTLAIDSKINKSSPAVLVFPNWMGITAEAESKIIELAKLGYIAMAADLYGKGIRPKDPKEAGALAFALKDNRKLLRERVNASLQELLKQVHVDSKKIFTTGYCFGGTSALELARSGAEVLGVVSFHGGLSNPTPVDAKNIKGEVLIFHGAIDPFVPETEVEAFKKEMDAAKVKYQFTAFSGAVHSFTDKNAGNDITKGAAYNEEADKKSWRGMKEFFEDLLKKPY